MFASERERFITEQATLQYQLVGPPEVRWGNFKEVSAWGKVHGYGHGSWSRHAKITAKTCLYLLLAYQLVRLFL